MHGAARFCRRAGSIEETFRRRGQSSRPRLQRRRTSPCARAYDHSERTFGNEGAAALREMRPSPADLIRSSCPPWFNITEDTAQEIVGNAVIRMPTAARDFSIDLKIEEGSNQVLAREAVVGTKLPASCPERHVNSNGSFCLGLGAETIVADRDAAIIWWGLLHAFLELQQVAERTGVWPQRQALSHGDAGAHHFEALEAARKLGIEEEYHRMLEGEPAWFSQPFPRIHKSGARLCNGRLPCPKGCKNRKGMPVPRRDCHKKEQIIALLFHERKRRKAEKEFWRALMRAGKSCCGTMRACPLRNYDLKEVGSGRRRIAPSKRKRTQ